MSMNTQYNCASANHPCIGSDAHSQMVHVVVLIVFMVHICMLHTMHGFSNGCRL